MQFHFSVIVWGRDYIETYLRIALPNHLSRGNLLAFPDRVGSTYTIYTRPEDEPLFRTSPVFARLEATLPTRLVGIGEEDRPLADSYTRLTAITRRAVQDARDRDALLVFLPPDNVYSDGTFPRLAQLARAGKKAVVLPGIRLAKESAGPAFLERWPAEGAGQGTYPARELVRIALAHLHPLTRSLFVNAAGFRNEWPSHLYWRVGDEGFLCRACHLHPLMVDPRGTRCLGEGTIDGAFLEELCADSGAVHIAQDSDDMAAFELSPGDQFPLPPPGRADVNRIARFIDAHTTPLHRHFLDHPIRIHSGDCSPAWAVAEREAEAKLARVRARWAHPFYTPEGLGRAVDLLKRDWKGRVVLYGAGEHTSRLFQWTELKPEDFVGIADGNPSPQGKERYGFRILPPGDIAGLRPDLVVISSCYFHQEIYADIRFLEQAGIRIAGFYGTLAPEPEGL